MDYAGRNFWKFRYTTNRPLTEEERALRFNQDTVRDAPPMDFLSVIKLNSNYIEIVDRWYPITGFQTWLGAAALLIALAVEAAVVWAFFYAPLGSTTERWAFLAILTPMTAALAVVAVLVVRVEAFRWTHYPMRLNRKTRQVHVFRQDGTVLTVPWSALFITLGIAHAPLTGTTYDLRAHVLDADAVTVRESFSLGYAFPSTAESMDRFWAFLQPYMEAPDGVERTFRHLKQTGYLMPIDGRKEGWRWSIARAYAFAGHWPWLQMLGAPFLGLMTLGRMFAMWTSKVPRWPEDVERASEVGIDDPYVLTWRDNAPLGWWELWYPLICTVLGVGTFIGVIAWVVISA